MKRAEADLTNDVDAPRAARRFVARVLREWAVAGAPAERTRLLVSELVSNAVLHGSGPVVLRMTRAQRARIRVEVLDTGQGQPRMRRPAAHELSGRGLRIVDELADGWGSSVTDGTTVVWFEMQIDSPG